MPLRFSKLLYKVKYFRILWLKLRKTLQNHKALLSTTLHDGMYYELTFNGDKGEIYLDAYKKFENRCIKLTPIDLEVK